MAAYQGEVVLTQVPQMLENRETGEPFVVASAAVRREEFDRSLGARVTVSAFLDLVAADEVGEQLMGCDVGQKIVISGDVYRREYVRKDGTKGVGNRCTVATLQLSGLAAPGTEQNAASLQGVAQ